jgi:hypothetical protein
MMQARNALKQKTEDLRFLLSSAGSFCLCFLDLPNKSEKIKGIKTAKAQSASG